jgi:hypothetical protein
MKKTLLLLLFCFLSIHSKAQTISIVGDAANGWNTDIDMVTSDHITYTLTNYAFTTGGVKFRLDHAWGTSWGGTNFPNGTAILNNSSNIPVNTGVYTVTFNSSNGTYTFIGTTFPSIGIWGPAVDSQNGYIAADVDMSTTDGITYTLSGFYFSSGNAYFRQDNATTNVWGSTSYPTGAAVLGGPSLFIPGGEHFVTFNRITGDYSFTFPSIGILGTALNGFESADVDLNTTDGFLYTLSDLPLTAGEVKFRKDNRWTMNWGAPGFPHDFGVQDGANIPIPQTASYLITFNRTTGEYYFGQLLGNTTFCSSFFKVYPNPAQSHWNFTSENEKIQTIEIADATGTIIEIIAPDAFQSTVAATAFPSGLYFAKITTAKRLETIKLIKE